MFFACCLFVFLDNPKEQFLQFSTASSNEYISTFDFGTYRQINVHNQYAQFQQVRFSGTGYASELSTFSVPINDLNVDRWLEDDFAPPSNALKLTATTGNNEDYRFALKYDSGQQEVSSLSEVVVHTNGVDNWSMYPGIYEPIMLGRFGRIDDAVKRGEIIVISWGYNEQSGCWAGEFRSVVDDETYVLVFDRETKRLRSKVASTAGIDQYRMEFEYKDKSLACIKIFQSLKRELSGKRDWLLYETVYFGTIASTPVDKSTMRLSHYGYPEPPIAPKQFALTWQLIAWTLLPIVGVFLMLAARYLTNKRHSVVH